MSASEISPLKAIFNYKFDCDLVDAEAVFFTNERCHLCGVTANYNPGQNIWNKIENSSETVQEKFLICFCVFLTAIAKV